MFDPGSFTLVDLKRYWVADFPYGRDFAAFPYERMARVFEAMHTETPETHTETYRNHLHATLYWLAFERGHGKTAEWFAERMGVQSTKTVYNWINAGLEHLRLELSATQIRVVRPGKLPVHHRPSTV